jgi:hypothetical protein
MKDMAGNDFVESVATDGTRIAQLEQDLLEACSIGQSFFLVHRDEHGFLTPYQREKYTRLSTLAAKCDKAFAANQAAASKHESPNAEAHRTR